MEKVFDLHKWKEKQLFLNEQDEDFTVDAPHEWDTIDLKDGDLIMPNMWQHNTNTNRLYVDITKPLIVKYYKSIVFGDDNVQLQDRNGEYEVIDVDKFNQTYLKPGFQFSVPGNLSESKEEDFTVDAPEEWGYENFNGNTEDYTDLENWARPILINAGIDLEYIDYYFIWMRNWGDSLEGFKNISPEQILQDFEEWKEYNVDEELDESTEEDFTVDAPDDWDTTDLRAGSTITPTMWNQNLGPDYNSIDDWIDDPTENQIIDDILKDDRGKVYVIFTGVNSNIQNVYTLTDFNNLLDPKYKVITNLNESEDDFNVDAPDDWNKEYLTVGSIIKPEMWDREKAIKAFDWWDDEERKWLDLPWEILRFTEVGNVRFAINDEYSRMFGLDFINTVLKPGFEITKELNESDEWSVEAPKDWDNIELKQGSTITPEMVDMSNIPENNLYWWEEKIIELNVGKIWKLDKEYIELKYKITDDEDHNYILMYTIDFLEILKPGYVLVLSDGTVLEKQDLNESTEDFTVDAPQDWDVEMLTVGSIITPEMWIPNIESEFTDTWNWETGLDITSIPWLITVVRKNEVVLRNNDVYGEMIFGFINEINNCLQPEYRITNDLNESIEDEFNVEAPDDWGTLNIGDRITPNMWNTDIKLKTPGSRIIKKTLNNMKQSTWTIEDLPLDDLDHVYLSTPGDETIISIDLLNNSLKPEYQIYNLKKLRESTDEFNVVAPKEWDNTELTVGSTITPEMWKPNAQWMFSSIDVSKPITIGKKSNPRIYLYLTDVKGRGTHINAGTLNKYLKRKYRVVDDEALYESEDEFNVEAPDDWNVKELGVGDEVTWDMFKTEELADHWMDDYDVKIIKNIYTRPIHPSAIVSLTKPNGESVGSWWLDSVERDLKSEYKIKVPDNMNENEDEWSVEAPKDWDNFDIEIRMSNTYTFFNIETDDEATVDEVKLVKTNSDELIKYFGDNIPYDSSQIEDLLYEKYFRDDDLQDFINQNEVVEEIPDELYGDDWDNEWDGVDFDVKIVGKVNEVEDEWSVEAPRDWDYQQLSLDDTITPEMWDLNNPELEDYIDDPTEDWKILELYANRVGNDASIFLQSPTGGELGTEMEEINKLLKPGYKIVVNKLNEVDEDEFNVEAPVDWNKEYLTAGDIITPSMIKPKLPIDYRFYKNNTKIKKIMPQRHGDGILINTVFVDQDGHDLPFTDDFHWIEEWNHKLIEPYTISPEKNFGSSLNELLDDEDEFNVEAPKEWDTTNLGIGDIIEPFMIEPKAQIDTYIENIPKILKLMKKYPTEITDIYNEFKGIQLKLPQWSPLKFTMKLSDIQSILKPGYEISKPSTLDEVDEDEFDVDAPKEWDIKVLTTGDILTNEHLGTGGNTAYKIIGFEDNRVKIEKGKILKRDTGDIFVPNTPYITTIPLSTLQRRLNPGYVIEPPTTKLSELLKVDDEFDVVAPDEWNEYDKNIRVVIEAEVFSVDNTNNASEELRWTTDKIININELENYSYDFKPFLGSPLDVKALNQWVDTIEFDWWDFMLNEGYEPHIIYTDPNFEEGDEIEDMSIVHKELLPAD